MIGSFLTRILVMILGYAYPAYECYKTVEKNKPEIEQLRFWCQYWILMAIMTIFERFADAFVSWVPFYSEAKLGFIVFLWYPKTKGSTFVYDTFFKPYVSKHETDIDRNLLELKTRAGDMAFMYCRKAVSSSQTRIFEILQYVAAQSTTTFSPSQAKPEAPITREAPVSTSAAATKAPPRQPPSKVQAPPSPQTQVEETLSPTSSTSSSQQEDDQSSIQSSSTSAPSPMSSHLKKSISMTKAPDSPKRPPLHKVEKVQITTITTAENSEKSTGESTVPEETVMEETIRVTRGRLRKTRSTVTK